MTAGSKPRVHHAWWVGGAALSAALYAGFRINECLGTDLVLAKEPAATALAFLHVLNSKRTPAVLIMVIATLGAAALAVHKARPRKLAVIGLVLLVVEDVLTFGLHVPFVLALESKTADPAPADWSALCSRYIFDDVSRTVLLLAAAIVFLTSALQTEKRT